MTKITFPRHADGTCDYESGRAVQGEKIVCGIYRTKKTLWLRKKAGSFGKVTTMKEGSYVAIGAYGLTADLEISGCTFNGTGSHGYDVETFANNGDHLKVTGATVNPLDAPEGE